VFSSAPTSRSSSWRSRDRRHLDNRRERGRDVALEGIAGYPRTGTDPRVALVALGSSRLAPSNEGEYLHDRRHRRTHGVRSLRPSAERVWLLDSMTK
jgi:hypothetical protein